jgi:hypothetical protein
MSDATREMSEENKSWAGAFFLPAAQGEKYFIAELSGKTKFFPFVESDRVELQAEAKRDVFARLADSDFKGAGW